MHGLTIGGGPEVVTPTRRGFGTRLVKEGTAFELRGSAVIDYAPGGVVCVVEIPFTATVSAGVHILIAEDEIFLAMMLQDLLEADGYEVSNAASVSDALAAIECKLPSAAILDVNLAGEKSYAVAQALRERSALPGCHRVRRAVATRRVRGGTDHAEALPAAPDANAAQRCWTGRRTRNHCLEGRARWPGRTTMTTASSFR